MVDARSVAARPRFAVRPLALLVAGLLPPFVVSAQGTEPAPALRRTPLLQEQLPPAARQQLPTFVEGDAVRGRPDLDVTVEGNAVLRRGDTVIRADRMEYFQPDDLARATGNVHINKRGNVYEGSLLELHVDAFQGFFNEPRYRFLRNDAYGQADRVDFLDENRSVVTNATYTTCKRRPGPDWMPDWILRASSIRIDEEEQTGQARDAVLSFKGIPVLPVPALSFPLSDQRKSGLLPPTFGLDNVSGVEFTLPYYWNIAPNRDATLYPTIMTKRGIDLAGEFRYLEPTYSGKLRGNYMPNDRQRGIDRWGYAIQHAQSAALGPDWGSIGLGLNVNRVSDDNYWKDFSRTTATLTQRLLAGDATASWTRGDFSLVGRILKWQTLQDPTAPITPPYDRSPQLTARWSKTQLPGGIDAVFEADHTRFRSDPVLNLQPNGNRSYVVGQVSRPWQAPGWFVVPKFQLHATHYDFEGPLTNGRTSADRTVPTFSLDSGLVFERDASFFGRNFRQTLEPRAFYVHTPFRDQNSLPNYDSAQVDFNFATIWTENAFGGQDRIADNNLLTVGVTSRLLDADTGAEAARFGIAQRVRFKDQLVTLPGGAPVSERLSDILFGASINWIPQWAMDTTLQYNPKTGRSERAVIGARYMPGNYRVVSAAYRLQRDFSEQIDIGWQWPLNDLWGDFGRRGAPGTGEGEGRWYSVGRLNYSIRDRRAVDSVIGLEYDGGCWIGRIVVERLQAGTTTANKRVLFQLEFLGFTRLGSNALQALTENIPRYQFLRQQVTAPSRFTNYE